MAILFKTTRKDQLKKLAWEGLKKGDFVGGPYQMAKQLEDSLNNNNGFDENSVIQCYFSWFKAKGFDTGYTTGTVLRLMKEGYSHSAAISSIKSDKTRKLDGCNPLHRSLPLALSEYIPDNHLREVCFQEAFLTHPSRIVAECSAGLNTFIRLMVNGSDWYEAKSIASMGLMKEVQKSFYPVQDCVSSSGYAPTVISTAIWCVENSSSFDEAIFNSTIIGAPANYSSIITGILGNLRF